MYRVFDPFSRKPYTIDEWIKNCGNRRVGECLVCGEEVSLKADRSELRTTHFAHAAGSACPTIRDNHKPFQHLQSSEIDLENATKIKQYVVDQAFQIYEKCKLFAEDLNLREFREMISCADEFGVWKYKGLTTVYIPYILLTCREMFLKKDGGKNRTADFFFAFDPNLSSVDELWIFPEKKKQRIWKIYPGNGEFVEYPVTASFEPIPNWFEYTLTFVKEKLG